MNAGKKFEAAIKKSTPTECLYYRIDDSTGTFSGGANLRFSAKQPCDAFIFNAPRGVLFAVEMKSTKSSSISFEDWRIDEKQPTRMIHKHQILSLLHFSKYENVVAGFLFNFRNEVDSIEHTYFQTAEDFVSMAAEIKKCSFNEHDIQKARHIEVIGKKMRVNYTWDLSHVLNMQKGI